MKRARSLSTALAGWLAIGWLAAPAATAAEVGLALGRAAPKFALTDQNATSRSLDSLLSRGKLAIVFFRSADW